MAVLRVASGSSPEYLPHVATMLRSVIEHRGGLEVEAHYLHGPDLPASERAALVRMVEDAGASISLHEVSDASIRGLPRMENIPETMWYRTFLPEILPDADKVLYLDADVLALDSLEPLWETDLGDCYLGAVTNVWEPWNLDYAKSLNLARPYFNSGVLLMNLARMRRDGATERIVSHARAQGWLPWGDQDALNVVLGAERIELHPRWNCMNSVLLFDFAGAVLGEDAVREARERPALRHFEGPGPNKPWHVLCRHKGDQAEYLRHRRATPWARVALEGSPWEDLSEHVVMVSHYGPYDGIGKYADQLIAAHSDGRRFRRIGIAEGPGDMGRDLHTGRWGMRALWLARDARRGDDIVVNYHPDYYIRGRNAYRGTTRERILCYLSWGALGLLRRVTLIAHEPDPPPVNVLERWAQRFAWRRAKRIILHSSAQREGYERRYGRRRRQERLVVPHGEFFATEVDDTREQARERLGLAHETTIALMIGFISPRLPDKGYDRALAAMEGVDDPSLALHIVGSRIRPGEAEDQLLERLRDAAATSDRIHLHEGHVDDATFDRWIRAADAVLTPYRSASSSGVIARAHLLGTRVISSGVGGLAEQLGPSDVVFADDEEFVTALRQLSSSRYRRS